MIGLLFEMVSQVERLSACMVHEIEPHVLRAALEDGASLLSFVSALIRDRVVGTDSRRKVTRRLPHDASDGHLQFMRRQQVVTSNWVHEAQSEDVGIRRQSNSFLRGSI